jgi:aspartate aminotransferase
VSGFLDLREAVCHKFERNNKLQYKPENIVISTGAKQSLANVILSIVDSGDEVLIPTPFWVTYAALVQLAGGKVKLMKTELENNYKITAEELETVITPKTKMFIFSSPCNPSGSVYNQAELASLADVFIRNPHITIVSDEIYEYINYTGTHHSIAEHKELRERVVIINGLSKGFAMTGWRLGYIAASVEIAKGCDKLQGQFTSGANAIAQRAAITALTSPLDATAQMVEEFARRRKRVMELMRSIEGFRFAEPDGAFYAFPCVDFYFGKKDGGDVIGNADDLAMYLLNKGHVSTVTGSAFGDAHCLRLSFANSMQNIEKGFERIKNALGKLK